MPAGDPAGYLPNVKRYRARKQRTLGAPIKASVNAPKALRKYGPAKGIKKGAVAKPARYTPDRGQRSKTYFPRPDGPLVGPYRKRRA